MFAHWVEYDDCWLGLNILIGNLGFISSIFLASSWPIILFNLCGLCFLQFMQWNFIRRLQRIRDEDWTTEILQPL